MTPGLTTQIRWAARTLAFLLWIGRARPAVFLHYITDSVRFSRVKRGTPAVAANHVAEVRAEFEERASQGEFKEPWFDGNVVPWCVTFSRVFHHADPVEILEIGSWEGRSTLFFLTYFPQAHLTAVDTWVGGYEYQYNATGNLGDLEARFDKNLASCASRLTKRKGSSLSVLPKLLDEEREFDMIYVDGSHLADDVLTDGINAWRLLKRGGVMIFDDVLAPFYPRARANPVWAINLFLKYYKGDYKILSAASNQIILQKEVTFTDEVDSELADLAAALFDERQRSMN